MAITINGDGTLTGVSVGGLPDGIVDTDMLATDAVSAAKLGTNSFVSYAVICDQKVSTADGGTFSAGDWRTRDLNTEVDDPDGIVTIASNQFTLGAGSYLIRWSAPAHAVNMHQTRLFDDTNTAARGLGSIEFAKAANGVQNRSFGSDRVTITANTTYEIQHRCSANVTTNGLGVGNSGATLWGDIVFAIVEIYKEA